MAHRRIFHVDLDAFFVAVERALDPTLEGVPVVVGGEAGSRGVVTCASYEARTYGLHAGIPLKTAQRLCPHAIYLSGKYAHYLEVSRRFHAVLSEYTPWMEPLGMDEAYMDMTGFESLYGAPADVARTIKERIRRELRVTASVGIASARVTAKVASDYGKPDGLVEVPPGQDAAFLAPLPVREIPGVGQKVEGTLKQRLGIVTVAELAVADPLTLRRIFGVYGDQLHRWATGQGEDSVASEMAAVKSISRSTTFAHDSRDRGFILGTLRYLGERVAAALRHEEKRAGCITVTIRYADFHTISRSRRVKQPVESDEAVFRLGSSLMEEPLKDRRAVRLIGIGVSELVSGEQLPLMADEP
ncbi:MAG: DNA polymerase IV, partial [Chloroflexi bacterium]|nr:DNA polymerase IV [Chloroflexota bacterium]